MSATSVGRIRDPVTLSGRRRGLGPNDRSLARWKIGAEALMVDIGGVVLLVPGLQSLVDLLRERGCVVIG